ncbi:sterile alpha motif domain-containing protein 15-like [Tubulanus polymorphus]|uniref:sterile alpha motif domain-containing protein 15-like n=1 Tax=Tubulanus polymorphus TaxID=672921 RepID=UPI003DA2E44C
MSRSSTIDDLKDDRVPSCLYWSENDVADWIEQLGFPCYRNCFLTNMVNGRKLIKVDASALPRLGITDFDHIKLIAKSIREMLNIEDPDWSRSISRAPRNELGMYIECKSATGEKMDNMTFKQFTLKHEGVIWQPPLANMCLCLPH